MKPHFGQSDAAMNKLAGINQLPNNNKPADLLKLRDVPCSCIPCKHYETPIDEIPCKYCRDHTKFEENYVIAAHKTPKRISPISYENGFEDGYEKAKKEYSVSMSGEMYVTEENMTPEPLPEGYYGHHNGCDCAVCDDIAFRRSLNISGVDAAIYRHEQREILEKLSAETLRDMVVDLGNALEGYKESFAIVTEELEKWKNGSKAQADKLAQLEELFQKETLMHHAAHKRAEEALEQLKKYEGSEYEGKVETTDRPHWRQFVVVPWGMFEEGEIVWVKRRGVCQ